MAQNGAKDPTAATGLRKRHHSGEGQKPHSPDTPREGPVEARKRERAETARQRTKAAHERLMATTGLSESDCGLRKHRLIFRELQRPPGWRWKPAPAGMALALVRFGLAPGVVRHMTTPPRSTCKANNRRGEPCRARGLANGRCRNHGGLSTGPRTAEGWARTRAGYRAWLERRRQGATGIAPARAFAAPPPENGVSSA